MASYKASTAASRCLDKAKKAPSISGQIIADRITLNRLKGKRHDREFYSEIVLPYANSTIHWSFAYPHVISSHRLPKES